MPKRILEGVVVSDKGDKTVVVVVQRTLLHPVMKRSCACLKSTTPTTKRTPSKKVTSPASLSVPLSPS
jgi:ribosomal protein S17